MQPVTRAEFDALAAQSDRLQRRVQVLTVSLVAVLTIAILLPMASPAIAQGYGVTLSGLLARVVALESRSTVLETKTASMSAITDPNTNQPTVRFENVKLQVVSGSGKTDGTVNGRGNLIIGYNERRGGNSDNRGGSHNLVIGAQNNYTANSYGGMVVGNFSSVTGGFINTTSGSLSSIGGGGFNTVTFGSNYSSITGGVQNTTSGENSSITGGTGNLLNGTNDWTAGGGTHN